MTAMTGSGTVTPSAPPSGAVTERHGLLRRWFPAVLTASFVMAGFFKDTGYLEFVPFDLTLGLGLATAVVVVARLAVSGVPRQLHGVVLAYALLIPPVFFSAVTEYGTEKVERLFTLTFLAILAPVALIREPGDVARHLWSLTALGGVVVVTALVDPELSSNYDDAPITTESVNTIQLGSAAGLVVVVLTLGLIWKRLPLLAIVPASAALYVLLQSGSRGPLLSAVAAVVAGAVLTRVRPTGHRAAIFGALLAIGLVVAYNAAPAASRERILALFGEGAASGSGRVDLYQDALRSIETDPLGIGWGGFQAVTFGGYRYPHNLALELLAEAGIVVGGLFLVWLGVQVVLAQRFTDHFVGAVVFAVVVFWLGKATVSGDLNDNRVLLYTVGVSIAARAVAVGTGRRAATASAPELPASRS